MKTLYKTIVLWHLAKQLAKYLAITGAIDSPKVADTVIDICNLMGNEKPPTK